MCTEMKNKKQPPETLRRLHKKLMKKHLLLHNLFSYGFTPRKFYFKNVDPCRK